MATLTSDLIHPTAVIAPEAELAFDVQIGPYSVVEGAVRIGEGTIIESHACLCGPMELGRENFVGHGAVLGKSPQHKGYRGEPTALKIGNSNVFREHVTVHRGTVRRWRRDPDRPPEYVHDRQPPRPRRQSRQRLHSGQRCTRGRSRRASKTAASSRAMAQASSSGSGSVVWRCWEVSGSVTRGHPTVRDPARLQLRLRPEPHRPPPRGDLHRSHLSPPGRLPDAVQGRSDPDWHLEMIVSDLGQITEVVEFVEFIRSSKIGISPARDPGRNRRSDSSEGSEC